MHGVLCHLCDVGPAVPGEKLGGCERFGTAPQACGDARYSGSAACSQGRTYLRAPAPRKTENGDGVTGLQQSPLHP